MHRSAAEGRFGVAEPVGRASVCAGALTLGVSPFQEKTPISLVKAHITLCSSGEMHFGGQKMGKLQSVAG